MRATPMSQQELLWLILGLSLLVLLFTGSMFVIFNRFLNREKDRGEAFRAVHRDD